MSYGGIEAGGTKWICAIGNGDGKLLESTVLPTTTPAATIEGAVRFFLAHERVDSLGVGTFGPVDLRPSSPTFGQITTTPKPGWAGTNIVAPLQAELGVPVVLDTDVNCAALGEWRWGAGNRLRTIAYLTVGTGVGGGVLIDGRPWHGITHPELGHTRIPHDRRRDPFPGSCPFHGDCLEGLASGQALRSRWGRPAEELTEPEVWELEAEYIALGLVNLILTLAPDRVILGGGVAKHVGLIPGVRRRVSEFIAGYADLPSLMDEAALDDYITAPQLGDNSGVHGAIELAQRVSARTDD